MSQPRTRTRSSDELQTTRTVISTGAQNVLSTVVMTTETCTDVVNTAADKVNGRYPPGPFRSEKIIRSGLQTTTIRTGVADPCILQNWLPIRTTTFNTPGLGPQPLKTSLTAAEWNQVLRSGPMTPSANLPLFVIELRDLPRTIRHAGDLLHGLRHPEKLNPLLEAASANLAYKFGWVPMIEDMLKLIDFAEYAEKRRLELEAATQSRGLRRRIRLHETTDNVNWPGQNIPLNGVGGTMRMSGLITYQSNCWVTLRWRLRETNELGKSPSFKDEFRTALGLYPGHIPATIWKALPWTWMIDWFSNISHLLEAYHNLLDYEATDVCLMQTRSGHADMGFTHNVGVGLQPDFKNLRSSSYRVEKNRRVLSVPQSLSVPLRMPHWDPYKLSVLGSLVTTGLLRRN